MSSSTTNPTRQQLEELDALLQRMLSLPVNPAEAEPTSAAPLPPPAPPVMSFTPPPSPVYTFTAPTPPPRPAPPRPAPAPQSRPAPSPRPAPPLPRRNVDVAPGDHSWNVPLPAAGGVSVYGQWPGGVDPLSASARPVVPQTVPAPAAPPPGSLRVTTIPSPDEQNLSRDTPPPMQRLRIEPVITTAAPMPSPQEPGIPFHLWPVAAFDWTLGKTLGLFGPPGRWIGQGSGKLLVGWCGVLMLCGAIAWGVVDYFGLSW